ncbi:MAG TPA: hypothetical protein VE842_10155, partial [Pyrinomonadaceae bacterium]|nr:hypothetical protein [Pyrinomonadaceae bacterium]
MATSRPYIKRISELPPYLKAAYAFYGASLLAILARLSLFVIREPYLEGDTRIVVGGVKTIRTCLG